MSNMYFLIAQLVGLEALILLVGSYFRKNTNQILIIQILSAICYMIHYYMLGAYSGFLICLFELIRDFAYYRSEKDKYIFMCTIPIYLIFGILTSKKAIDILPILASLTDGYSLTKHKKFVVIGAILSHLLWIVYDFSVESYSGALTCLIVILSNLSILFFDKSLFKEGSISVHLDNIKRK